MSKVEFQSKNGKMFYFVDGKPATYGGYKSAFANLPKTSVHTVDGKIASRCETKWKLFTERLKNRK